MDATTYGESGGGSRPKRTREYQAWHNMRQRCTNRNIPAYIRYGYIGITVCKEWNSYRNFLEDMGRCPPNYTLERKNNNYGYAPQNCYWATYHEQGRNKANNVWLKAESKRMLQTDWAKELGISFGALSYQLKTEKPFTQIVAHFRHRANYRITDAD